VTNGAGVLLNEHLVMMILLHSSDVDIYQHLYTVLRGAVGLNGTENLRILIVGEESDLFMFRNTVSQPDLRNVEFQLSMLLTRFSPLLAEVDIDLTFHGQARESVLVLKRTSDTWAAGRPSLLVGRANCETAVILEGGRSGCVVTPGDMEGMEEGVRTLVPSPALREDTGRNARDYYEYYFRGTRCRESVRL
jgi:hypothetical protein